MRNRLMLVLAAVLGLCPLVAAGDTVYLHSGKTYEGEVTTSGDKVIIKTGDETIELAAENVLTIVKGTMPASTSAPADEAATTQSTQESPAAAPVNLGRFNLADVERPEPYVFALMRTLSGVGGGTANYEAREQMRRWQIMAHDRKRKADGQWLAPAEFVRRREAYISALAEAEKAIRDSQPPNNMRNVSQQEQARLRQARIKAMDQLAQAARTWADPALRSFLMGVAYYQADNHVQAEAAFRAAFRQGPRVAGYAQGMGLAQLELDRASDALDSFMTTLKLQPDSSEALRLVRECMRKVPGAETRRPGYAAAQELVGQYTGGPAAPRATWGGANRLASIAWMMPGDRGWMVRGETLPVPPYDRLTFRQGAAVAISENLLLVDAEALRDALEIFVIIDGQPVPAAVQRVTPVRGAPLPPVALLKVEHHTLKPAVLPEEGKAPAANTQATIHAMNIFESMGSEVRKAAGVIKSVDKAGGVTLNVALAPGESAAPILTQDNVLAGFVAGRTDAQADMGGPEAVIQVADLEPVLKVAARSTSSISRPSYGSARVTRTVEPKVVEQTVFAVIATCGEKIDK